MPGPLQPRLPWDDLWALARWGTMTDLADQSGVDIRDLYRYRAGGVPEKAADRIAVGLGLTPELIWGVDAWAEASARLVERAEAAEAKRRAKVAATKRLYRRKNPVYAERQRAKVERWKADNPDRVRRYHADYQREWRERQGEAYRTARAEYQRAYRARKEAAA